MSFSVNPLTNPLWTNKTLYSKYSSSQTYYYSNIITEITKQKKTSASINYEDIEYACDSQQYFKRFYFHYQFSGKMFTFKEYYFYHEDCPRIFMKSIEEIYSKWQDRRRDLVYKKLKILYNQSMSTSKTSSKQDQNQSTSGLTHFLLEISQYNPFSKKYYLRIEAKNKEKQLQKQNDSNKTAKDLSRLNHDLSVMLNDISQLSIISTLSQQQSPRFSALYHSKKLKVNYSSQTSTYHNSQSNSNIQSTIKFNFTRKKTNLPIQQKQSQQLNKKLKLRQNLEYNKKQQKIINNQNIELQKFNNKFNNNNIKLNLIKNKSIIQLSNFNLNKKNQIIINNNKKDLKIKYDKINSSKDNKTTNIQKIQSQNQPIDTKNSLTRQVRKIYDSEQKYISKSQSQKKLTPVKLSNYEKVPFQSLQLKLGLERSNKTGSIVLGSWNNLKNIPRKSSLQKQGTTGSKQKASQFSDSRFQKNEQIRFRSHKSEYFSLPKQGLQTRTNSPSKISLKAKQDKKPVKKDTIQLHINKKRHQLKIQ